MMLYGHETQAYEFCSSGCSSTVQPSATTQDNHQLRECLNIEGRLRGHVDHHVPLLSIGEGERPQEIPCRYLYRLDNSPLHIT